MNLSIHTMIRNNVIGRIFNHLLVFVINIMMVRWMGIEQSGLFFNKIYCWNFFALIMSGGLDFSANYYLSQLPDKKAAIFDIIQKVSKIVIALGIVGIIMSLCSSNPLISKTTPADWIYFIGLTLTILFSGWLSAKKKFQSINHWFLLTNIVLLSVVALGKYWDNRMNTATWLIYVYGCITCIQGLGLWWMGFIKTERQDRSPNVLWKPMFQYGWKILVAALFYFLFLRIDLWFLETESNLISLSKYQQVGKLGQYFLLIASMVGSTLLPMVSNMSLSAWKIAIRPYLILLVCLGVFMCLTAKLLFPVIFGQGFEGMEIYFWIQFPGFIALVLVTWINIWLMGKGDLNIILIFDVIGFIVITVLDAILIPMGGAIYAAWISSCCYILMAIGLWKFGMKKYN
jgi:O-antigen/teichoic acid export membrane protein